MAGAKLTETIPRYLLAPPGSISDALRAHLGESDSWREVDAVAALFASEGDEVAATPGWIFLAPSVPPELVVELLKRLAREPGEWSPLLMVEERGGLSVIPLSAAVPQGLPRVLEGLQGSMNRAGLYSYRVMLRLVSGVRHDINNALTAALAEAQLALLDVPPGSELEAGLRTVEGQLRRIRDLMEDLGAVRASGA